MTAVVVIAALLFVLIGLLIWSRRGRRAAGIAAWEPDTREPKQRTTYPDASGSTPGGPGFRGQ